MFYLMKEQVIPDGSVLNVEVIMAKAGVLAEKEELSQKIRCHTDVRPPGANIFWSFIAIALLIDASKNVLLKKVSSFRMTYTIGPIAPAASVFLGDN